VFEGAAAGSTISAERRSAPLCPRSDLNALDRTTAGYWSPGWQTASGLLASNRHGRGCDLALRDEGFSSGLIDAIVVAESALAATAAAS